MHLDASLAAQCVPPLHALLRDDSKVYTAQAGICCLSHSCHPRHVGWAVTLPMITASTAAHDRDDRGSVGREARGRM